MDQEPTKNPTQDLDENTGQAAGIEDNRGQVDALVTHCKVVFADDLARLHPPDGYGSVALSILDAIWSIGVRYTTVGRVLDRYRAWVAGQGSGAEERSAADLADDISKLGIEQFSDQIGTRQRTSTRNGILKADAAYRAATAVAEAGVGAQADLQGIDLQPLKAQWTAIPGQGSGISWRYFLMNNRIEDVKPDRMVIRFVTAALLNSDLPQVRSSEAVALLVRQAHDKLRIGQPDLTLRALDHAMWCWSTGRPLRLLEH